MIRFSKEQIDRMRQLRRGGFTLEVIAKVFQTDKETVWYHVKDDKKGDLVELAKALLPHLPLQGPPLPQGYTLRWVEAGRINQAKNESLAKVKGLNIEEKGDNK